MLSISTLSKSLSAATRSKMTVGMPLRPMSSRAGDRSMQGTTIRPSACRPMRCLDALALAHRILLRLGEKDLVVAAGGQFLEATDHRRKEARGDVGHDDPDHVGAAVPEAGSDPVGAVVEGRDRVEDPLPLFRSDEAEPAQHVRYRCRRDSGRLRHVAHGRHPAGRRLFPYRARLGRRARDHGGFIAGHDAACRPPPSTEKL